MKLKKSLIASLLTFAAGAFLLLGSVQQESAAALFEKAVYLEETKGDLEAALEIYGTILDTFAENQVIAAKTLYRIGQCHERLGSKEAEKAYRRLIEQYPGQKNEVALARARLAELTAATERASEKPTFRKIRIPANPGNGVLSPDGKRFAFVSQGSVWVVPIPGNVQPDLAGEAVRLTEPVGAWNLGNTMAWSGDGKWIAFNVYKKEANDTGVFVVSSSGGEPFEVPISNRRGTYFLTLRLDLSRDGRRVAFSAEDTDAPGAGDGVMNPPFMYTIPAEGGRVTRQTDAWGYGQAFSPDGKNIAFTRPVVLAYDNPKTDLWVMGMDGKDAVQLTDLPGRVKGPVWSPDGRMIAVNHEPSRDRSSREIWIVRSAKDGGSLDEPIKIKLPNDSFNGLAGWPEDNRMGVLMTNPLHQAVYTVPAAGGQATQVTPEDQDGYPCYPKWSPDGERIFLRWGRGNIVSIPAQGGKLTAVHDQEKTGLVSGIPGMGNCISPDGNTVVFMAGKTGTQPLEVCIWTAPVAGGEPKQITRSESPTQDRYPCFSPDGKSVAFIRSMEKPGGSFVHHIFVTSSEGGEARQITSEPNKVGYASIDWSPDGRWIAYFGQDKTINLIPAQGGEHKVLLELERFGSHSDLSWSPDGKELAYTSAGPSNMGRLMVVSADGGEPREVKTGVLKGGVQNFHVDWSPDGSKFVFTAGFGGDAELWLMENFIHLVKDSK